ncbi:glycosyltransferase family 4 protein [Halobacteriaceae archaeon GCM10025711]
MGILHVITRSDWGGAPKIVETLATGTEADTAVACGSGGKLINRLEDSSVDVFEIEQLKSPPDPLADLKALSRVISILNSGDFDLVHCHSTKAGALGRIAAAIVGLPSVFTVHGWGFYNTEYRWLSTTIKVGERLLARTTDSIVCVSENDLKVGESMKISSKAADSRVVKNGIPEIGLPDTRNSIYDQINLDRDIPVIGAIARLAPQKNPIAILRTVKELRDQGIEVAVVLIGDGPLMSECREFIEHANINNAYLLGFVEDALELLPDLDVFLLPSRFEGLPLTVLESMHLGVPLVAYDVGGVPEVIEDGETGYVVPKGDFESFVAATQNLVENEDLRVQFSQRARELAVKNYSADRMISEYEAVYDDLL